MVNMSAAAHSLENAFKLVLSRVPAPGTIEFAYSKLGDIETRELSNANSW